MKQEILAIAGVLTLLLMGSNNSYSQNINQVDHIRYDKLEWEQLSAGIERKYVYGAQGMLATFRFAKGAIVPRHNHPNEQITYITQGSAKVTIEGKGSYVVKAGEVIIIPPNFYHNFEILEDNTIDVDYFTPLRMDWLNSSAGYLGQNPELEVVAELPFRPGNVAVSKKGRVFSTAHPLGDPKIQLFEVTADKNYTAYPSAAFQKNGGRPDASMLDTPLGVVFDKNDNLWVIDMGQQLGRTRLWCFDIEKNKVLKKIELDVKVAPTGSFIQDLAIDEKNGWAYLADIANPGIIAVNLNTGVARRFGDAKALQSEDIDMVIEGKVIQFMGRPARVAINPITLSDDRETLYFGAMNGTTWYQLPAKLFRNHSSDFQITSSISKASDKPISDGAATDSQGTHYFTDLASHGVSKTTKEGKAVSIITDSRLNWPDNLSLGGNYIYVSVNQLSGTPAFTGGVDTGKSPFYIYRFKINK
ncbi:cupin [Flavobacteriaceae bacterium CRH]|nr:cupin [Flavobacteriaceae bacterium CRH]